MTPVTGPPELARPTGVFVMEMDCAFIIFSISEEITSSNSFANWWAIFSTSGPDCPGSVAL